MRLKYFLLVALFLTGWKKAEAQKFEWAKSFGSSAPINGKTLEIDESDNIYSTGTTFGPIDLDPDLDTMIRGVFSYAIYLSKLDSNGKIIWGKTFNGGGQYDEPVSMLMDKNKNLYVMGNYSSLIDVNPDTGILYLSNNGFNDIFITKLDSNGVLIWAKKIGGAGNEMIKSACMDENMNLIFTGTFNYTTDFDPDTSVFLLNFGLGNPKNFICKLDSGGHFLWAKQFGSGITTDYPRATCSDNFGNIYITGSFDGPMDFDPDSTIYNMTTYGTGTYLCKLDSNGHFLIGKSITPTIAGKISPYSMIVNTTGHIYITGNFGGTQDFDPGIDSSKMTASLTLNAGNVFVVKFDTSFNFIWSKQTERTQPISALSFPIEIELDSEENVYIMGWYNGTMDMNPDSNTYTIAYNATDNDQFIWKLDSAGSFVSAVSIDGCTFSNIYPTSGIEITKSSHILVQGSFLGVKDLDPSTNITNFDSQIGRNVFIEKLTQGICSLVDTKIDSAQNISCSAPGYAQVSVLGSSAPYSFQWDTYPVTPDSSAYFTSKGIYTCIYSDSLGCISKNQILIDAPDSLSGFDLNAHLVSTNFRPGFSSIVWIDGFNAGCIPVSGSLTIILDTLVLLDSSSVSPTYTSGDTLSWNFSNLTYDSVHVLPKLYLTTKTNAQIGDTVHFNLTISPQSGDYDSGNNAKYYKFPIVNGYDPNDISVYPIGDCDENYILNNQTLTYTIRFQNTGNSDAINIHILNPIDPALDLNTIEILSSSHSLLTEVLPDNVLNFRFDNIMLPDSNSNELLSHGYVTYTINQISGISNNTLIRNIAGIYFDFNPVVETNFVKNTSVNFIPNCSITTAVKPVQQGNNFLLYPNPTKDLLNIENISAGSIIKLYDLSGRLLMEQKASSSKYILHTANLESGVFIVEVSNERGRSFERVVINR